MATLVVNLVLDETGSMLACKDATIEAFNAYIASLKERQKDGENILFGLTKFNSGQGPRRIQESVLLENIIELTQENYQPNYSTPLLDAVGKTIADVEASVKQMRATDVKVLCIIQTDGYENDSHEYTLEAINKMVTEKITAGWEFAFLGANIDAWATGKGMGIPGGSTLSYAGTPEGTRGAMAVAAAATSSYRDRDGEASGDFFGDESEEARRTAGGGETEEEEESES